MIKVLQYNLPVGVSVIELHCCATSLVRGLLDALEDVFLGDDGTAGHGGVSQALGAGDHVGGDIELIGGEGAAESAEAGDDLVEDQQDIVLVADLAQALQVAHRGGEHAGTA